MSSFAQWYRSAREHESAGRISAAEQAYRQALALEPQQASAWLQLSMLYHARRDTTQAVECAKNAVDCAPQQYTCWNMLGATLRQQRDFQAAEDAYRRAMELQPNDVRVKSNLGNVLIDAGKFEEAEQMLQGVLRTDPRSTSGLENLARLRRMQQRYPEVLPLFDRLLKLEPNYAKAHLARAEFSLFQKDFLHGWDEYEWRWQIERPLPTSQPLWQGEELPDRTILLWTEQGFGDTIQFIRYAQLVKPWVGRVLLRCPARMIPLLSTASGIDAFVPTDQPLPPFDVHAPLLSLPRIFLTNQFSIPATIPYLAAEPARIAHWQQQLGPHQNKFRIGIAWKGSQSHVNDHFRSIPLLKFEPLAKIPNVELISLQGGEAGNIESATLPFPIRSFPQLDRNGAFLDSAALITQLSLVVACDTSIGHLAGALGCDTFLALCIPEDWRWHVGLQQSLWYPRTRLFRQSKFLVWDDVFARISAAVREQMQVKL